MAKLVIEQIPILKDNYVYLLHDETTGTTAVIDPGLADPVAERLAARDWRLSTILSTHHHDDHVGGNLALKERTGCHVAGHGADARRIPGIDIELSDGAAFMVGDSTAMVLATPGHTRGHVAYWFPESAALFCGDTLFAMGCGRLFEGSPAEMWASLTKLRGLPGDTGIYCAHEYTQSNARFARTVERDNAGLPARIEEIDRLRAKGLPTVPSRLALERETNPFLRADEASVKKAVGMEEDAAPALVFAEIRRRKDVF